MRSCGPVVPEFTLPSLVGRVVARLPARPPAWLLSAALDFGVGRIVDEAALDPLRGRRFALVVRDMSLALHVELASSGFRPCSAAPAPDLAITATLRDFLALAARVEDPDTLFFARRLTVEGDTALGLVVKNLLDGIDWSALLALLPAPLRRRS